MTYTLQNIWKITWPIIVSMILQQCIGITDVIYLGRVSTEAQGASGLGATYFFALFTLISGFTFGVQIISARRNGEQNYKKIGAVFFQGISFLLIFSVGLIYLSKSFSGFLLSRLIEDEKIFHATTEYLDWRIFGLISTSFLMMFRAFFVSIARTFVLQIISGTMLVSNIILNYIFIFGFLLIPPLGVKGAAIASVLSEIVAVLAYLVYFIQKVDILKYGFNKFVCSDYKLLIGILKLSLWTMLQQFASIGTWFLFFIAVEHLGAQELAVANILKNSAGIPWLVVVSFGATAATVTSNLIGEKRTNQVLRINRKVIFINRRVLMGLLCVFALLYYPILRIFTDNPQLLAKAVLPYMTALLCYLPLFSGWVWFQAISATGRAGYTMFIELVSMIFYLLFVVVFILYMKVPLYICMLSDGLYNLVIAVMSYRFMQSAKWKGTKF